jgi:hypothetical protein
VRIRYSRLYGFRSRVVKTLIESYFVITPDITRSEFIRDTCIKAGLVLESTDVTGVERLVRALEKKASDDDIGNNPILVVAGNIVAVRVPSFDSENTGVVDNLGIYLRWVVTMLGVTDPKVKLLRDAKLGNVVQMPARVKRMIENTTAALTLPASETGERAEFKTGFKANLVELLAAIRLARKYAGTLQKGVPAKGSTLEPISVDMLRKSLNGRAGLNEHGIDPFVIQLVKAVFNEMTKPNFASFPGGWIHSLKVTNQVKNNIGLVYRLGYETKVPNVQKTLAVIKTVAKTSEDISSQGKTPASKKKQGKQRELFVRDAKNTPDGISHREFRLAVVLTLPLIDPKGKQSLKDQVSVDPLTVRNRNALAFYSKNRAVVDECNLAYATKSACGKKNTKATPLAFKSAKGHAVRLSAKCVFTDSTGREYQKFSEIAEHVQQYLLKLYNRKLADVESSAEESANEEEEAPAIKVHPQKSG